MRVVYRKIPSVACPYCGAIVKGEKINYSELKQLFNKKYSPIPIQLECRNGHMFVVFIYPEKGRVKISDISESIKVKR